MPRTYNLHVQIHNDYIQSWLLGPYTMAWTVSVEKVFKLMRSNVALAIENRFSLTAETALYFVNLSGSNWAETCFLG